VKRFTVIMALLVLLLIGGGLTTQLIANQGAAPMPVLRQTDNPEAAVQDMVPWKAEQFFLLIGFLIFNLVGIAITLAIVFWLIDRGIRRSRNEAAAGTPARAGAGGATPASITTDSAES
jgi:hypothetical protein